MTTILLLTLMSTTAANPCPKGAQLKETFYDNTKHLESRACIDDHGNGLEVRYYDNGARMAEIPYVNNKIHGVRITWRETGEVSGVWTWNEGFLHGPSVFWEKNAEITRDLYFMGKHVEHSTMAMKDPKNKVAGATKQ